MNGRTDGWTDELMDRFMKGRKIYRQISVSPLYRLVYMRVELCTFAGSAEVPSQAQLEAWS